VNPESLHEQELLSSKVFLSFFNVVGVGDDEHLLEELQDFYFRQKDKILKRASNDADQALRYLMTAWVSRLKLEESEWIGSFILRALFVEGMDFRRLAVVFGRGESKIRALALDALLEEVSPSSFFDRDSRNCARNDLYLLDNIAQRKWNDPLGIYTEENFREHLLLCERCRDLFSVSKEYGKSLEGQKLLEAPKWIRAGVVETSPNSLEIWSRTPLPNIVMKMVLGTGAVVVLFLGVVSIPYWRTFIPLPKQKVAVLESSPKTENVEPIENEVLVPDDLETEPEAIVETKPKTSVVAESIPPPPLELKPKEPEVAFVPPQTPLVWAPEPEILLPEDSPKRSSREPVEVKKEPLVVATSQPIPASRVEASQTKTTKIFFRWGARAQDPDRIAESVLNLLSDVNAVNAGELEFGALHRGGRYFHFTLAKREYEKLLSDMKALSLSDFTDSAADSDRTISADQSRVVLWIGPTR